jgi:hypothetical protein
MRVVVLMAGAAAALLAQPVDFARDVEPLLRKRCSGCHGAAQQLSGLRLDRRADALRGGYSGAVIVPGDARGSRLWQLVTASTGVRMPPAGPRLSAGEVDVLRRWIDAGAPWPERPESAAEARPRPAHWAFQPVRRPAVPPVGNASWARNPIDRFVLARLEQEGVAPSPPADSRTLIRRLHLDLTGLPPAPDEALGGIEDTVARLLASPHFGEKWARHWLDLARYADSDGYEQDQFRPHAWRYRDWVIGAFNRNLPFDQFTVQQIAGDLLPGATLEEKTATGFHRQTLTSREGGLDTEQLRTEQVADRVATVGTAWLGLTLECARCHDHKYDPVSQRDFYQLYAFFNSADEVNHLAPVEGEVGPYLQKRPEYERRFREILSAYRVAELQPRWEREVLAAIADPAARLEWTQVADYVKVYQDHGHEILHTPAAQRTFRQAHDLTRVFLKYPGPLASWPEAKGVKFAEGFQKLEELDADLPGLSEVAALAERATPRPTRILLRGDFRSPGIEVEPDVPGALPPLPAGAPRNRLGLARWLVERGHPLTARVTVNRVWQELFGRGLVATSEDFGTRGDPPSHPELLDWLAAEFMDSGWDFKHIVRLIVESATYRQSSRAREDLDNRDPLNTLLARQQRLRLPAELIRDSALAASGLLHPSVGGRSFFPPMPAGLLNVAYRSRDWRVSEGPERHRRTLYAFFWRSVPHPQRMNFDAPDTLTTCSRRQRSTTPLQALNLLNDPEFHEAAHALAARVMRERADLSGRVARVVELALARPPHADEVALLTRYYVRKRQRLEQEPALGARQFPGAAAAGLDPAEAAAWAGVASVVLNLDEFITRE